MILTKLNSEHLSLVNMAAVSSEEELGKCRVIIVLKKLCACKQMFSDIFF